MTFQPLIVDDDPIFVLLMQKLIAKYEQYNSPLSFSNGQLALKHLEEHYQPDKYFLIFLDINMPVMNGWEFLEAISKFAEPKNTFVFIVSSSIHKADMKMAAENPFVLDYLTKPILGKTLIQMESSIEERLQQ